MRSGERAYRRHLPHFQSDFRKYFVTWVTKNRWVLPDDARDVVLDQILRAHEQWMYCYTAVVMPDHVHIVLMPLWDGRGDSYAIADIVRRIKGPASRIIGGSIWQDESFDHGIRSDESLEQKCEYVRQNPVRRGLVSRPEDYIWLVSPILWHAAATGFSPSLPLGAISHDRIPSCPSPEFSSSSSGNLAC